MNLFENLQRFNENITDELKDNKTYNAIIKTGYRIEITDKSVTIYWPKPDDNKVYAHYTFRYDDDFEAWVVRCHDNKPESKGRLILDELEDFSSYESVVKQCLYHFWNYC